MKTLLALAVALSLAACSSAQPMDPNYQTYVAGEVAKAAEQSKAETARLLAITAISQSGDDRVKDRALSELQASRQGVGTPSIAPPAPKPNEALQWAQVLLNPLATLGGIAIQEHGAVKRDEQATIRHGITFGTIGNIAQGGYDLGAAGISGTRALGEAGIAKIPSVVIHTAPVAAPAAPAPVTEPTE